MKGRSAALQTRPVLGTNTYGTVFRRLLPARLPVCVRLQRVLVYLTCLAFHFLQFQVVKRGEEKRKEEKKVALYLCTVVLSRSETNNFDRITQVYGVRQRDPLAKHPMIWDTRTPEAFPFSLTTPQISMSRTSYNQLAALQVSYGVVTQPQPCMYSLACPLLSLTLQQPPTSLHSSKNNQIRS